VNTSKNLRDLRSHQKYKPDAVNLACGRVAAVRAQLGLSRADFAIALARLLGWHPTADTIEMWERCVAPPTGDVLIASEVLASRAKSSAADPENLAYVPALLGKHVWNRDDLSDLSKSFDAALSHSSVEDIMRLSHVWLVADPPQIVELVAGRRISNQLIATVEHRVVQLRRADDFVAGRESHALVRRELAATTGLLERAACTQEQARRVLTAVGELAQLASWVAADGGMNAVALGYAQGGILAARAACNAPLAANIISTLSYQLANTGNAQNAAVLARTAYAGGSRQATPRTKALLLERIAWADAKSGDLRGSERALGQVNETFAQGPHDDDPDWVYWLNQEEIDVMAGRCYTELKQPERAEPLLRHAIERYNQTLIRENSLYLSWLAESYVQLGEIDEAAAVGQRALELGAHAGSARANNRVRHLAGLLSRYKTAPGVAPFLDLYREQVGA
jgi:tetratricopeptide (TPR) repeat protein